MFLHLVTLLLSRPVSRSVARHRGDAGDYYVVFVEFQLGDGVERGEARLFEVVFGDRIAVDDDRRTRFEPFAVGLERCGVHRHQHVAVVAGVELPVAAEVNLESRYARHGTPVARGFRQGSRGRSRSRSRAVPRCLRKRARKLHAVARVA